MLLCKTDLHLLFGGDAGEGIYAKTGCSDGASCIVYRSRCGLKVEIEIAHRFGSVGAYLDDVLCIVGSIGHHVFHDVAHKERDYEHRDSAICQR